MSRLCTLAIVGVALAVAIGACGGSDDSEGAKKRDDPRPERVSAKRAKGLPNVVVIYTDDQNLSEFKPRYMPRTFRLLADPGTIFDEFVVATPLCCPSRVTYLTGNYPHNSGVFSNRGGYGNVRGIFNTLPVWMRNAGYRTAWVGKYLQGYEQAVSNRFDAAPGYDDWHATFDPSYYDFEIADNGEPVSHGTRSRDYYTNVITDVATGLIAKRMKRPRPLYLTVNNLAPHQGNGDAGRCTDIVVPAPRDEERFRDAKVPRTVAFDERDVSDKPEVVRVDEPLKQGRIERLDLTAGCRLASLRGVDRSVAEIYKAVDRAGELKNTVFLFTSDNGILQGQHRIGGKNIPYEEGIKQPLAVLAGRQALGGGQVSRVRELTANVDLAPTILDLGRAKPCARPGNCRKLDGRSLVPLLRGREARGFGPGREILIEGGKGGGDCFYAGIRMAGLSFVEHARESGSGGCNREAGVELYDLDGSLSGNADPLQLDNLASAATPGSDEPRVQRTIERLNRRLRELRRCSGSDCR